MSRSANWVVVGGTGSIGRVVVRELLRTGARVTTVGRRPDRSRTKGRAHVVADLRDTDAVARAADAVRERGAVDHVVFVQRYRDGGDDWAGELEVNLSATKTFLEAVLPGLRKSGDRSIVIVSSNAARLVASEQGPGYHVARAGLEQMVRYYAVRLGPLGIRVNGVSPCLVLKDEARSFYEKQPALTAMFRRITPLRRMGTPVDIAGVIRFLGSSLASYLTGQILVVDGGLSLQSHESLARSLSPLRRLRITR